IIAHNIRMSMITFEEYSQAQFEKIKTEYLENKTKYNQNIKTITTATINDIIRAASEYVPMLNTLTIKNMYSFKEYLKQNLQHVNEVITNNKNLINTSYQTNNFNWTLHIFKNLQLFFNLF